MKKIALGMMAVALTLSAMAQTTDNSAGDKNRKNKPSADRPFRGGENLNKLNLTDAQKAQIKTINESFRQQMQDLNKQGNITVNEQKQKREALAKDHRDKIAAILTPEQRQQTQTLTKDFRDGQRGMGREDRFDDMTKNLNLTPDQSAKMESLNTNFRTSLQNLRQNSSLSQAEKREQMRNLMKQHRSDMEALLTNDQKQQLKSRRKNSTNRTVVK